MSAQLSYSPTTVMHNSLPMRSRFSIAEKKAAQLRCASLLGRDVLHRLRMSYNFRKKKIVFTVTSADARVALDKRRANSLKARIEKLEPLPQ